MSRTGTRIALIAVLSLSASAARGQDLQKTQAFVLARYNYTELKFKTTAAGPCVAQVEFPGRLGNGVAVTLQLIRMADGRPVVVKEATTRPETRELDIRAELEASMPYVLVAKHTGTSTVLVSGQLSFLQKQPKPVDTNPSTVPTKRPVAGPRPVPPVAPRPVAGLAPDLSVPAGTVDQADNSLTVVIENTGNAKAVAVSLQLDIWLNGKLVHTRTLDIGGIEKGTRVTKKFVDLPFARIKALADMSKRSGGAAELMWGVTPKVTAGTPDTNTADNYREDSFVLK